MKNVTETLYDEIHRRDCVAILDNVLDTLTDREKLCIELRFFQDLTLKQIGDVVPRYCYNGHHYHSIVGIGITPQRVREVLAKGMRKLRNPIRTRKLKEVEEYYHYG